MKISLILAGALIAMPAISKNRAEPISPIEKPKGLNAAKVELGKNFTLKDDFQSQAVYHVTHVTTSP